MQASAEKIWGSAQQSLRSLLNADTYNLWFRSQSRQSRSTQRLHFQSHLCGGDMEIASRWRHPYGLRLLS